MLRRTLCLLALATTTFGCGSLPNWTEEPAPVVAAYEPTYYENRVVYFSDSGSPYYYDGPTVVWIQPTWPGYAGYVRHYHHYGPSYHAWHRGHVHPGNPYAGRHRGGVHVHRGPRR